MRAAILTRIPGPLEIVDVQVDKPGPHEVLVRVVASGLCHSDLHFMEGKYVCDLPSVLGHEAAGIVEAVGADVVDFRPGDHVVACLSVFCGHCDDCLSGRPVLADRRVICSNLMPPSARRAIVGANDRRVRPLNTRVCTRADIAQRAHGPPIHTFLGLVVRRLACRVGAHGRLPFAASRRTRRRKRL